MPRRRKTLEELKLSGGLKRNPGRYAGRTDGPQCPGPLGDPPATFSDKEAAAWRELAAKAPAGVLWLSDRWLVELASKLMASIRTDGIGGKRGVSNGEISVLMSCLRLMGLTPADRSKITSAVEVPAETNPFAELAKERIN